MGSFFKSYIESGLMGMSSPCAQDLICFGVTGGVTVQLISMNRSDQSASYRILSDKVYFGWNVNSNRKTITQHRDFGRIPYLWSSINMNDIECRMWQRADSKPGFLYTSAGENTQPFTHVIFNSCQFNVSQSFTMFPNQLSGYGSCRNAWWSRMELINWHPHMGVS